MINEVACKIKLPDHMKRIHPVFHVSKLRAYASDGRYQPPPPPMQVDDEDWYEVDELLMHEQKKNGKYRYFVKFKGYGPEHNMWLPSANISEPAIQAYWESLGYETPPTA